MSSAEDAWDRTRGAGIRVAVIDNGFLATHEDLRDGIVENSGFFLKRAHARLSPRARPACPAATTARSAQAWWARARATASAYRVPRRKAISCSWHVSTTRWKPGHPGPRRCLRRRPVP